MNADLARSIQRLGLRGAEVGRQIERAQASSPIAEHFEGIVRDFEKGPFTVVLLGLDAETRSAALGALAGGEHRNLSVAIPRGSGLVEVRLADRGYALEMPGSPRQEFDEFERFADAVQASRVVREGDAAAMLEPVRLRIEAQKAMRGVSILIPESLAASEANPRIVSRLRVRTNTVCIAGRADQTVKDEERAALAELTRTFAIAAPLVCVDSPDAELPRRGFWDQRDLIRSEYVLPPSRLLAQGNPGSQTAAIGDEQLRSLLLACFCSARLRAGSSMIRKELGEDREVVKSNRASLEREQAEIDKLSRPDPRREPEQARDALTTSLRDASAEVEDMARRAMLPEGPLTKASKTLSDTISNDDLQREPIEGSASIRLVGSEEMTRRLADGMVREIRKVIRDIGQTVATRGEELQTQFGDTLARLRGETSILHLAPLDDRALKRRVQEAFDVRFDCRAELEKHSFWRRLAKGRQAVFTVLMTVSLFGGVFGVGRRDVTLPLIMLPLFTGALVMTYFSFARQDRDRIRRELHRLREQARQQLERQAAESMRDLQDRVRRHLDEWRDQLQRRVENAARTSQEKATVDARERRDGLRVRIKTQEQRDREIQNHERRAMDFEREVAELEGKCLDALRSAIRSLPDGRQA